MVRKRVGERGAPGSIQPLQVVVEVDDGVESPRPAAGAAGPSSALLALLGLVVVSLVAIAFIVNRDETDAIPDLDEPAAGSGDLTIAASFGPDRIIVQATSSTGTAPWVAFEVCDLDPAGCAPLWTADLDQEGGTYRAELRPVGSFRSAGGFDHDCTLEPGCELWVVTADRAVSFPVETEFRADSGSVGAAPDVVGLDIDPRTDAGSGRREVTVAGPASADYDVAMCVPAGDGLDCAGVLAGELDGTGRASAVLRLPRVVAIRPDTDQQAWVQVDCGQVDCRLRVEIAGRVALEPLRFDADSAVRRPSITVDAGEVDAGEVDVGAIVEISGEGFARINESVPGRAGWLLCGELPVALADVPTACGTPRSIRAPVIGLEGEFRMSVLVPEPSSVRTWATREPIECGDTCWVVVLAEPFPEIVAAPIRIRPSIPE